MWTLFNYVRDKRELLFLVFEAGAAYRLDRIEGVANEERTWSMG
jgi:hypothetical protein